MYLLPLNFKNKYALYMCNSIYVDRSPYLSTTYLFGRCLTFSFGELIFVAVKECDVARVLLSKL